MSEAALGGRAYVEVTVSFLPDGAMVPRSLVWENGRRYEIEGVSRMQPAQGASGGQVDRCTVTIRGQQRELFFEHSPEPGTGTAGRWFVVRRRR